MSKHEEQVVSFLPGMISLLLGGGVALASAVMLLLAGSCLLSGGMIAQSHEPQLVVAVVLASAVIGGMTAKRGWNHRKVIAGILSGLVFYLLLVVIGLLFYSGFNATQYGVGNLVAAVCGGAMAGMMGGAQGRRGKRRNRK